MNQRTKHHKISNELLVKRLRARIGLSGCCQVEEQLYKLPCDLGVGLPVMYT